MSGVSLCALLAIVVVAVPALAATPPRIRPPSRETGCDLGGWAATLPVGNRPLRVAPDAAARSIGVVRGGKGPSGFAILASRNGWLRARVEGDAAGVRPAVSGWIDGALVRTVLLPGDGYARPSLDSERRIDLAGGRLSERGWIVGIAGCSERWVLVDYRLRGVAGELERVPAVPYRAWFRGACSAHGPANPLSRDNRECPE